MGLDITFLKDTQNRTPVLQPEKFKTTLIDQMQDRYVHPGFDKWYDVETYSIPKYHDTVLYFRNDFRVLHKLVDLNVIPDRNERGYDADMHLWFLTKDQISELQNWFNGRSHECDDEYEEFSSKLDIDLPLYVYISQ